MNETTPGAGTGRELPALRRRLAAFAAARDWQPYHTPKNLAAALSVEAAELLEIFQWLTPEESARVMADPERAHRVEDEVADVLAYLLQFCEVLDIDPAAALAAKIDRNERRFPVPEGPGRRARSRGRRGRSGMNRRTGTLIATLRSGKLINTGTIVHRFGKTLVS
ncbi:nucleotide pyrophosphohydrolase [Streptomyces sp. MNU89]|uniref:nucleotide pyrophosphohydrolase n=1 Tax=Streptomyces sp. MNU89 TaxID=2560025 RepID=UPI001E639CC9|nr:nucleotide pyrophosphohydrolase [Streptomyces sp. MNU89]MCC9738918.1 nucleotide pyrophosphohydrolase [Streptomyces sp. MNU89]